MKKRSLAKSIIRQAKKRNKKFLQQLKKEEPIIARIQTIDPEKGLTPFSAQSPKRREVNPTSRPSFYKKLHK